MGVAWKTLETLDELIDQLFCVGTVELERLADEFLTSVIRTVITMATRDKRAAIVRALDQFHHLSRTGYVAWNNSIICVATDRILEQFHNLSRTGYLTRDSGGVIG